MDSVKKVAQEIYDRIDNDLYHADGDRWWQSDSPLYLIQSSVNPARVSYLKKKLFNELKVNPQGKAALEVGCGGGLLCEEIARMGFDVTGIDPSEHSLQIATNHAKASGLRINYEKGTGEALPCRDNSSDIVFCCDVLEHVRDVPKVISEICRVLKPGGVFCYDTLNRTFLSKLVAINISQVWKRWAFAPPNLHVWEMFIKPDELKSLLEQNNLAWKEHMGMELNVSFLKFLRFLRKRARGALSYKDLGERLFVVESSNMNIMYMGYAIKGQ
jgi:2-polyprenyl-6-hydroxyphenyl methylase/3-demethylubiquinone-9 3-methyltransferase